MQVDSAISISRFSVFSRRPSLRDEAPSDESFTMVERKDSEGVGAAQAGPAHSKSEGYAFAENTKRERAGRSCAMRPHYEGAAFVLEYEGPAFALLSRRPCLRDEAPSDESFTMTERKGS